MIDILFLDFDVRCAIYGHKADINAVEANNPDARRGLFDRAHKRNVQA
jgi:hypothetical protein